jgi:hypothetical protein
VKYIRQSNSIKAPAGGLALPLPYTVYERPTYSVVPSNALWRDPEPWSLRYVPMAEVAVSRQIFAEILSLIARLRPRPRRHEEREDQMRRGSGERWCASIQAEQRVPRLGAGQTQFSTPLVRVQRDWPLQGQPDGATLVPKSPGIWGMSVRFVRPCNHHRGKCTQEQP